MLFTLIIAALAGAATPYAQTQITETALRLFGQENMPDSAGQQVLGFAVMLLAAAVLLKLSGEGSSVVLLVIGGILGRFHREIRAAMLNR